MGTCVQKLQELRRQAVWGWAPHLLRPFAVPGVGLLDRHGVHERVCSGVRRLLSPLDVPLL